MCSIEYTPTETQNGLEAFDLGAVGAPTAANTVTAHVCKTLKNNLLNEI